MTFLVYSTHEKTPAVKKNLWSLNRRMVFNPIKFRSNGHILYNISKDHARRAHCGLFRAGNGWHVLVTMSKNTTGRMIMMMMMMMMVFVVLVAAGLEHVYFFVFHILNIFWIMWTTDLSFIFFRGIEIINQSCFQQWLLLINSFSPTITNHMFESATVIQPHFLRRFDWFWENHWEKRYDSPINTSAILQVQQTMKTASSDEELAFKQKVSWLAVRCRSVGEIIGKASDNHLKVVI